MSYLDILLDDPDPVPLAFAEAIPLQPDAELPVGEVTPLDEATEDGQDTETTETTEPG